MDACNYVAATDHGTFVVVVDCQLVGEFIGQRQAEDAYNARKNAGGAPSPAAPAEPASPDAPWDTSGSLPNRCGGPDATPPPAVGGYWQCVGGKWQLSKEPVGPAYGPSPGGTPYREPPAAAPSARTRTPAWTTAAAVLLALLFLEDLS